MFAPPQTAASQPTISVRASFRDAGGSDTHTDVSPLLSALLERLPATDGRWSAQQRERWLRAFTAMLDLEVTTEEDGE